MHDQHTLDTAIYSCCPKEESEETKWLRKEKGNPKRKKEGEEFEASLDSSKIVSQT